MRRATVLTLLAILLISLLLPACREEQKPLVLPEGHAILAASSSNAFAPDVYQQLAGLKKRFSGPAASCW